MYKFEYRLDVMKKQPRMIWMHYDQDNNCSYVQTIAQNCHEDTIEFAVNMSSLRGLVDVNSIVWNEPEVFQIPSLNTMFNLR